ncbi:uncharacterized protein MAM_08426 [Metarhizium album ARSEF 1941]|uniref:Uncharacterized protein n=1 Tax=Metarhizium album (strain ARSEF 1941) TaxID=1081103 RepID=A0A0B2WIN5_METAS|nr:uncharacterized protein MAM_08426 [Metarhizium album ARSEF 1941]KHN93713.1 hypothetical protein MAM_08426 [Metarhizium album ARSEF 1941]
MSVTSSQFSKKYVGFIDEEENEGENYFAVSPPPRQSRRKSSGAVRGQNTVRVQGGIMKPTPSLEKMFASANIGEDDDEEDCTSRPAVSRGHYTASSLPVAPLDTQNRGNSQRRKKASKVGFGDE